jgi:uncharacterized protein involved in exopolysaccharide biosynthesis
VLQEQARGAIEAAARLKGEITASEVQLEVMRNFATEANSDVVSMKLRLVEMRRQLAKMQYGETPSGIRPNPPGGERYDFSLPFAKVPEVGLELARLTRDLKVQETVVTLLTQQLEQARIAEAKDLPVVQVLDRAVPPEYPARPRLLVNLIAAAALSLLLAVVLTLFVGSRDKRSSASLGRA